MGPGTRLADSAASSRRLSVRNMAGPSAGMEHLNDAKAKKIRRRRVAKMPRNGPRFRRIVTLIYGLRTGVARYYWT
jgi:hypothetical protein